MLKVKALNNVKVKKIDTSQVQKKKDEGFRSEIFNHAYPNCFLVAKKNSGKTNLILNIVKQAIKSVGRKKPVVFLWSSTLNLDDKMKYLLQYLEKRNIPFFAYTSIFEENSLQELLDAVQSEDNIREEMQEKDKPVKIIKTGDIRGREKKPEKLRYICIFDDLGNELRSPLISKFVIKNRHYRCLNLFSAQHLHHLDLQATLQMDCFLLFKDLPIDKLKNIYDRSDLSIPFEKFLQLYHTATHSGQYNFLYVDTRVPEYRINFNLAIE